MMELSLKSRLWSFLQVVSIIVCYRGKALSADRAQGCVGSQLRLRCLEMKVIQITAVFLGDSSCYRSPCCIKDDDCTHGANESHTMDVHRRCDNKQVCTVDVLQEKIPCGYRLLGYWPNNDFERITYNCIDDLQRSTTATPSRPGSTEKNMRTSKNPPGEETGNVDLKNTTDEHSKEDPDHEGSENDEHEAVQDKPWILPVVMAIICLLVLIAIVAVVVMLRRKKWRKGGANVEMSDFDSYRTEAIYANDNQTVSQTNGSGSQIYSNDKIKKTAGKGAEVSKDYEVPSNAVYNLAHDADSRPTEDPNIYCDVDSREPAYLVPSPRDYVYSVVRDFGEPECADSNTDASVVDKSVCSDVDTKEPVKSTNSSARKAYDEAIDWKESEYEEVRADATILSNQKKNAGSPPHKTTPVSYYNVTNPMKIGANFVEPLGKVESRDRVSRDDDFPSSTYETMSPGIPESIYANGPALSPSWSVASSRALSTGGGSDTYCDMQSPPVKFKDDGSQTVVENDLYSH